MYMHVICHLFQKFTYIHTYIHTYMHAYIPTYLPTYLPTYVDTYMHNYGILSLIFIIKYHGETIVLIS